MATRERPTRMERVKALRQRVTEVSSRVDPERYKYLLEVYRETEGEPNVIRRAKFYERFLREKTIFIDDNLLAGTLTKYTCGAMGTPESTCRWMRKHPEWMGMLGPIGATEEDRELVDEVVDYWGERCIYTRAQKIFAEAHKGVNAIQYSKAGVWLDINFGLPQQGTNPDFPKVLNKGINGIMAEVEEELDKLPAWSLEAYGKRNFYHALLIVLNAVVEYAGRYASLAREMAQKEADSERKNELEKIAETMEWVPANPARDYYEAVQSIWFTLLCTWLESQPGTVLGSLPRYLYPFYKEDKEQGKITEEEAIELLGFLFVKIQESPLFVSPIGHSTNSGQIGSVISLGGQTADGSDATNDIDFFILETQRRLKCIQPSLQLYYHDKLSEEFLLKAVDVVRETGLGQPAFYGYNIAVERHLDHQPGITLQEAREVTHIGCVQTALPHATFGVWSGAINMVKMLELALNNGMDPLAELQLGPETGEAESFQTYEELYEAVKGQLWYFLPLQREFDDVTRVVEADVFPQLIQSALTDDCIKQGKDVTEGGARYSAIGTEIVANIDLANSLAAIKKLVFDEKRITMQQLKEALDADFEGYEDIQHMCQDAPKYGNDDLYVDQIAKDLYGEAWEAARSVPILFGNPCMPYAFSLTTHFYFGSRTGALPTGRKAKIALTDATCSAMPGTDTSGPTALVKSATHVIDNVKYGTNHFNMKFHPSALEGKEGARKLLALIKTYIDLGGSHIQFNCVSGEVLQDAQIHPEEHRDLVVRVAGFSAFFVHLDKGVQDEVIKRTELKFD